MLLQRTRLLLLLLLCGVWGVGCADVQTPAAVPPTETPLSPVVATTVAATTVAATPVAARPATIVAQPVTPVPATVAPTFDCAAVTTLAPPVCVALVELFRVTGGEAWGGPCSGSATAWLTTSNPCEWCGVICAGDRLIGLELPGANLTGLLPPAIGALTDLERLDLRENGLSGGLPPEIGRLERLTALNLSRNRFGGPLPAALGDLRSLVTLDLSNNLLEGAIPPEFGRLAQLEGLNLNHNRLTGLVPAELADPPRLGWIDLSHNRLSGPLPPALLDVYYLNVDAGLLPATAVAARPTATSAPQAPVVPPTIPSTVLPTVLPTAAPSPTVAPPAATRTVAPPPVVTPTVTPATPPQPRILSFEATVVRSFPNGDDEVAISWKTADVSGLRVQIELGAMGTEWLTLFSEMGSTEGNLIWRYTGYFYTSRITLHIYPADNTIVDLVAPAERLLRFTCAPHAFPFDLPLEATLFYSCPARPPQVVAAVYQPFEHGMMVWDDTGALRGSSETGTPYVTVLTNTPFDLHGYGRTWALLRDDWDSSQPISDPGLIPPPGLFQPEYGFGKVWRENNSLRETIGWATAGETRYTATVVQVGKGPGICTVFSTASGRVVEMGRSGGGYGSHWWKYVD